MEAFWCRNEQFDDPVVFASRETGEGLEAKVGKEVVDGDGFLRDEEKAEEFEETTDDQGDVCLGCLWVAFINSFDDWDEMFEGKREIGYGRHSGIWAATVVRPKTSFANSTAFGTSSILRQKKTGTPNSLYLSTCGQVSP